MKSQKLEIKKYLDYFIIVFSIFLGIFMGRSTIQVITFAFVVWQILYPLPSKILARFTLFLLVLTPFVFIMKQNAIAYELAVAAFYFMIFTLIMMCIRMNKNQEDFSE